MTIVQFLQSVSHFFQRLSKDIQSIVKNNILCIYTEENMKNDNTVLDKSSELFDRYINFLNTELVEHQHQKLWRSMSMELQSTANFIVYLFTRDFPSLPATFLDKVNKKWIIDRLSIEQFRIALVDEMRERYKDHWFTHKPYKGTGFRSIQVNEEHLDVIIRMAAIRCKIPHEIIHAFLPKDLTVWVDPFEVTFRHATSDLIFSLYLFKQENNRPWQEPDGMHILLAEDTDPNSIMHAMRPSKRNTLKNMNKVLDTRDIKDKEIII